MSALVPVLLGLIGLFFFLAGLTAGLLELCDVAPTITAVVFGLLLMALSAGVWFELLPRSLLFALRFPKSQSHRVLRQRPFGIVGVLDVNSVQKGMQAHGMILNPQVDHETTETLLKSIRGIPYLIQAIHFSLESSLLSSQSVLNSSVIHTAPGCSSVLDCNAEDEHVFIQSATPRLSTGPPEEQWMNAEEANRWTNPQLNLLLNRANSTLTVFPYSESRPLDDVSISADTAAHSTDQIDLAGSRQSALSSRVTVSFNSSNQHEVRCIGMTSAFLSRFNNSFRT